MLISLTRSGEFHAKTMRPNPLKCAAMRTRVYPYTVRIEATDSRLSPEGFIFNNERVSEYFDTRFGHLALPWDAISCERMALTACRELAAMLQSEGIDVQCVECQILGSNGALIKGIWNANSKGGSIHGMDSISQTVAS